jgi:hypothetical protein
MSKKQFYVSILDQFANTGDELLALLDAIETGAVSQYQSN